MAEQTLVIEGRIPRMAFEAISGIFFSLAIIAAAARLMVQIRLQRRVQLDNAILLLGCVCLIGATSVLYIATPNMYLNEALALNPSTALFGLPPSFFQEVSSYQKLIYVYLDLGFTTIFAIKFCFLHFFRVLVDRQQYMLLYWRVVVVFTILVYMYCICSPFIECSQFSLVAIMKCATGAGYERTWKLIASTISLDIATDLMIIAIPVRLLWKVRMKLRQKLNVGLVLCLSICMIVVAVVKASSISTPTKSIDIVCQVFWHQIEACVAVITYSLTAFRSLFVSDGSKDSDKRFKPSSTSRDRVWRWRRQASMTANEQGKLHLPTIPSATMTGLRTFVQGGPKATMLGSVADDEDKMNDVLWSPGLPRYTSHVKLTHDISVEHTSRHVSPSTPCMV